MSTVRSVWSKWFGFSKCCLVICVVYVLLGGSMLVQSLEVSMAPFQVPLSTLRSPHYIDAMHWVYSHMLVLGLMIGWVGWAGTTRRLTLGFARLMLVVHIYYTWLDFRASDSMVGVALYKGPASVIPAFISLVITFVFLYLSVWTDAHPVDVSS